MNTYKFHCLGKPLDFEKVKTIDDSKFMEFHSKGIDKQDAELYSSKTHLILNKEEIYDTLINAEKELGYTLITCSEIMYPNTKSGFKSMAAYMKHLIFLFETYQINYRQLIYTSNTECVSMIHIIPVMYKDNCITKKRDLITYRVTVYQRSSFLDSLLGDVCHLYDMFKDANDITYIINNVHFIKNKLEAIE